jgi:hypothetical protein
MRRSSRFLALFAASVTLVAMVSCNSLDSAFSNHDGSWGGSPGGAQPVMPTTKGMVEAVQVQDRHTAELMEIEGVVGTGASVAKDESPVVVVFTESADVSGIPTALNGVPVVVEVVGKVTALQSKGKPQAAAAPACAAPNRAGRFERPVPIGVSTGHFAITAGTIGVRVKNPAGKLFLLSNNHVFANTNNAAIGDNILQPGPFDGGVNPADAIGTLNTFVPITFCAGTLCAANKMDAALVSTTAALSGNATPCDGYGTPSKSVATAIANLGVKKYGRTTGLTSGVIGAVNVTIDVGYAAGVARFTGQVYIATPNFIGPGDSGSLIVTESGNKPVALVFAGTSTAAFATPINDVLKKFNVTVDGI